MTGQTVGNAVARGDDTKRVGDLVLRYQEDYAKVLPQHIDASHWVRLAQGLLRRDETLAQAATENPNSFLAALLECARLGHEPGTDQYALVPFKEHGRYVITGIEQYQGEIERMYRAGAVDAVICEVVRKSDMFLWNPGNPPQHDADWFATAEVRGPLVGVYAYAVLKGGSISKVVVMGGEEVARHKEVAKTDAIWRKWPDAMWRKTAIHELEKWVPTSSEFQRERLRALAEADVVRQQAVFAAAVQVPTVAIEATDDNKEEEPDG